MPFMEKLGSRTGETVEQVSFSEYHSAIARLEVERGLVAYGKNPVDWAQATIVSQARCVESASTDVFDTGMIWTPAHRVYQLHSEDQHAEHYVSALPFDEPCFDLMLREFFPLPPCHQMMTSVACRLCGLPGLNNLRSRHAGPGPRTLNSGLLSPPVSASEEHERRSKFWHAYLMDRYSTAGNGWEHFFAHDAGIATSLPVEMALFQEGRNQGLMNRESTRPICLCKVIWMGLACISR